MEKYEGEKESERVLEAKNSLIFLDAEKKWENHNEIKQHGYEKPKKKQNISFSLGGISF